MSMNLANVKKMADISKCSGISCPFKETCYRFTSPSNEFRQAWYDYVPVKEEGKLKCDSYWGDDYKKVWTSQAIKDQK